MELAHALAHSSKPNAHTVGLNLGKPFPRHPLAVILNLHIYVLAFAANSNPRSLAS